MQHAVRIDAVVKTFDGHRAVDALSLCVPRNGIFGLIGPNGAGKTTTIRMIMDIIRPDAGEIRVLGLQHDDGVKDRIGYLPEERGLYRRMKVLEMLEFQGSIKGAAVSAARREAAGWLDRLGLSAWSHRKVEELSKGMQQKVQLIAAVMGRPDLLILDEPFAGMDPVNQDLFRGIITELARAGATVVLSTHQMDTAERLCDGIALVDRGRVVLEGTLESLRRRFGGNEVRLEFEGDHGWIAGVPGVVGVTPTGRGVDVALEPGADPQALLAACVGKVRLTRFETVTATLHGIFMKQVGARELSADA